jgi:hypothetical protein
MTKIEAWANYMSALATSLEIPSPSANATQRERDAWWRRYKAADDEVARTKKILNEL